MFYPVDSGLFVARWFPRNKHVDHSVNVIAVYIVMFTITFCNCFVHLPMAMHGEFSFSAPQGPCITFFTIISCNP